jgi:hypothetical protein
MLYTSDWPVQRILSVLPKGTCAVLVYCEVISILLNIFYFTYLFSFNGFRFYSTSLSITIFVIHLYLYLYLYFYFCFSFLYFCFFPLLSPFLFPQLFLFLFMFVFAFALIFILMIIFIFILIFSQPSNPGWWTGCSRTIRYKERGRYGACSISSYLLSQSQLSSWILFRCQR